jgi:hypothetical protein
MPASCPIEVCFVPPTEVNPAQFSCALVLFFFCVFAHPTHQHQTSAEEIAKRLNILWSFFERRTYAAIDRIIVAVIRFSEVAHWLALSEVPQSSIQLLDILQKRHDVLLAPKERGDILAASHPRNPDCLLCRQPDTLRGA